jgi:hypothetical protein
MSLRLAPYVWGVVLVELTPLLAMVALEVVVAVLVIKTTLQLSQALHIQLLLG